MRTKKASTMIEALIALLMVPLLMTLSLSMLNLLTHYDYQLKERTNFIAILQLRKRVALGSQIKVKGDRLLMNYRNREIELICEENKLYEIDGYMEYLTNIEGCEWEVEHELIFLRYRFDAKTISVFIGYEA